MTKANNAGKKCITIVLLILLVSLNLGCLKDPGWFGPPTVVSLIAGGQEIDYDEVMQINVTKMGEELKDEYEIASVIDLYPELGWENGFEARALDHGNGTHDAMYFLVYANDDNETKDAKFKIAYSYPVKDGHYIEYEDEDTIEEIEAELRVRAKHIAEVANVTVDVDDFYFVLSCSD